MTCYNLQPYFLGSVSDDPTPIACWHTALCWVCASLDPTYEEARYSAACRYDFA